MGGEWLSCFGPDVPQGQARAPSGAQQQLLLPIRQHQALLKQWVLLVGAVMAFAYLEAPS
jgi:hypothetical protein